MGKTKPPTPDEFYCAVGRATTAWQLVEDALCDLFTRLVTWQLTGSALPSGQSPFILGLIFYSPTNFRGRIEMLDTIIAKTIFDADLLAEWNTIQNRMGRIYSRRNTLAHSHAWGQGGSVSTLAPSILAGEAKSMNYLQILAARDSFKRNAKRIEDFAITVTRYLASPSTKSGP